MSGRPGGSVRNTGCNNLIGSMNIGIIVTNVALIIALISLAIIIYLNVSMQKLQKEGGGGGTGASGTTATAASSATSNNEKIQKSTRWINLSTYVAAGSVVVGMISTLVTTGFINKIKNCNVIT